ncbi:MAG TPA: peptidylprolyl isomerase [Caulobacteraceae bacterium]|nr:peptidylprolyl isomerase [Caulobacteraceae bacterium]
MRFTRFVAGVAAAAILAAPMTVSARQQTPAVGEGVAALVNDDVISTYDLKQRMMLLMATTGVQPTEENLPRIQQQALRSLIDERLQLQELKRFEVEIDEAEIEAEVEQLANDNNITKEQLLAGLQSMGVRPQTLREQLRAEAGWRMLVRGRFNSRARVGDDQIDAALQQMVAANAKPKYLVGEIFIDAATVGGQEEAQKTAQSLVEQLLAGAPFQAVARQFSNAPSAAQGGDAGWLIAGDIAPELETVLAQMNPGQLSKPIVTDQGAYLVYLREKREGEAVSKIVTLKQTALRLPAEATEADVAAASRKLESIRSKLTCDNIEAEGAKLEGAVAGDLGETDVNELAPAFRQVTDQMKVGQVSAPVRTSAGMHLLALCGERQQSASLPSREQIENRLFGQQLTMLAKRYLRDLRNSATIETR